MHKPLHTFFVSLLLLANLTFNFSVSAQCTWTGAGGNNLLLNQGNWEGYYESHTSVPLTFANDVSPDATWGTEIFAFYSMDLSDTVTVPHTFSGSGELRVAYRIQNSSGSLLTLSFNQMRGYNHQNLMMTPGPITLSGNSYTVSNPYRVIIYGDDSTYPTMTVAVPLTCENEVDLEVRNKARVILARNNQYRNTAILSGNLQVGDGGNTGTLGQGAVAIHGTSNLSFKRGGELIVNNEIVSMAGEKTLVFEGPGTVRFQGPRNNTGVGAIVQAGTLVLEREDALCLTGDTTVQAGARLEFGGIGAQISTSASLGVEGGTVDLKGKAERVTRLSGTGTILNSAENPAQLTCTLGSFEGLVGPASGGGPLKLRKEAQGTTFAYNGTAECAFEVAGGTAALSGEIEGQVLVYPAGLLSVGGEGRSGSLTLGTAPSLGGTMVLEIAPDGSCDKLLMPGLALSCQGALVVSNLGALTPSGVFDLVDASAIQGEFASVTLPEPGAGRNWITNGLYTTGTIILNTQPTAPKIERSCAAGLSLKLSLAEIVAACFDPDAGDSVSLVSITKDPASTASITVTDTQLFYVPAVGQTGVDTLSYEVQDTRGAKTTGVIEITVGSAGAASIQAIRIENGKPVLQCVGIPGYNYIIERSENAYFTDLVEAHSFQAGTAPAEWTDPNPPTTAFYRLRWVP